MQEEGYKVLKKQRLCVSRIDSQLSCILDGIRQSKERLQLALHRPEASSSPGETTVTGPAAEDSAERKHEAKHIVLDFMEHTESLHLEQNVANELKSFHIVLSKFGKQIDKQLKNEIAAKISQSKDFDHSLVTKMVAEYLYQNGQIEAADAFCLEAKVDLPAAFRDCFEDLQNNLKSLAQRDLDPAIRWAQSRRRDLCTIRSDIEFELIQLKYLDLLEKCTDVMDAIKFANAELSLFHDTHMREIGRLMSCALYKKDLQNSPYKELFQPERWMEVRESMVLACCNVERVPYRPYLQTCLAAGTRALPAMKKLASVPDNTFTGWIADKQFPVEFPLRDEHRFHSVFSCPVSKEESTPENPPVLLKCGHVICRSCVKRISFNVPSEKFKCPTCPMDQTLFEISELIF
uniref:RMD5 family protein putative n=1 Tax=Albugo laibachii Nc14 TaxID=890382 RepID=F0WKS5_9STRA|nr:RMD5 family protein putative [Albugo laibachii Nc14]|eukprot:CCA21882.1 RMD5 family protein putative [Albugo laibachii Nc14]